MDILQKIQVAILLLGVIWAIHVLYITARQTKRAIKKSAVSANTSGQAQNEG